MKLNQPIINSEIESYKKEIINNNSNTKPDLSYKYLANYNSNQDEADKATHLSAAHLQNNIYRGSPAKGIHQTSSSIGAAINKSKQQTSKSFHSQNIIPSQSSLSAQKQQSGEKPLPSHFSAQKNNLVSVNGFNDESKQNNQQNFLSPVQKDQQSMNNIGSNSSFSGQNNETFKVYARVRPINAKEKSQQHAKKRLEIIKTYENSLYVLDPDISRSLENQREKSFGFDQVFGEKDDNQQVYEGTIATLLKDHLLEGYNTTVFAYGQTGAGKTYTLFGDEYKNQDFLEGRDIMAEGIVSLIIKDLFNLFSRNKEFKYSIKVSYLEIYNENIRDLLVDQGSQSNLMLVEDPQKGILIPELSEFSIKDSTELNNLIRKGNTIRVMASTHSNQFSSRSHCIIQINIEKIPVDMKYASHKIVSKLSLIDLAGSERAAVSENKGIRMMEGSKINRSLLALGNCINILSDSKKQGAYVPYRDSKLTRLLKDSLGGTTKTVMIACVAPSFITYEETINTLKYAQRAKNIQNKIKQNIVDVDIHVSQYKEIIDNLKLEIESLKKQLNAQSKKQDFNLVKSGIPIDNNNKGNKDNNEIEELSGQIFLNIEENWEIAQTLKDLESLRQKNQELLLKKQEEQKMLLKITMTEQVKDEILKLSQEIQMVTQNMENNDNVFQELQANLEKNNQQKKLLREKIKLIVESNENGSEKSLEETCRLLQLEKMDLFSQNIEIKKEAQTLAIEKEKTVNKLKQMEREMELMKQQLQEKDKIISKSSQIITQLKQKEQSAQPSKTPQQLQKEQTKIQTQPKDYLKEPKKSVSTFQNLNLLSPQLQTHTGAKKIRDKSVSSSHQDNRLASQTVSQANFLTQERSPIQYQNQQDIYYRPKDQSRQLSSNRQEQQKRKKQPNNFSQTNLQVKSISNKEKIQTPQSQQLSNINNYNSVKQNYFQTNNNQEDIKKEYYYFDQNKKLQKRGNNIDDVKVPDLFSPDVIQQVNIYKNDFKIDEQRNSINQQSDQKQSSKKDSKGLKIDLDSLKKFDEIQKIKAERKQQENVEKVASKQEVQVAQPKQKGKKKNKNKHNIIEEKITIDELKNYAQKLKDIDFENIKIKPNLKKFQKNNENSNKNNNNINNNINNQMHKHQIVSQHQNSYHKQQNEFSQHHLQQPAINNLILSQKLTSESGLKEYQNDQRNSHNFETDHFGQMHHPMDEKLNKQNKQQYQKEINSIQDKIVETQQLISSLKLNNNEGEVINDFQRKNKQIFEEYSNIDKNLQQKQQYYSKSEKKKDKSADQLDFEKYLQQVTQLEQIEQKTDEQLMPLNDISYMNKVVDNSVDITIQDCLYSIEKAENNHQNHFHLVLDPKQYQNKTNGSSVKQQKLQQATPDKNKLNLKSLDEARVKIRSFKHQLSTLNDKIKSSQVTPDIINLMKSLIKQYDTEQISLSGTDENIIKEFRRILTVFKEYDNSNSSKNKLTNANSQKQIPNLMQSSNPQSINFASTNASNQVSQTYTTRPRSINSVSEETALQNQYYQQNNFTNYLNANNNNNNNNNNSNRREYTNQSNQNQSNQNHSNFTPSNNISVNKKSIEQGAFSKILNNYGEAAKVINSSSQPSHNNNNSNNNSNNFKKYAKGIFQTVDQSDSSRRNTKSTSKQEKQYNSRQNIDIVQQNSQSQSEILNSQGLSYLQAQSQLNENKKDLNDSLQRSTENFNKNNLSNMAQSVVNQSNQAISTTNRGKSVTSYVQINNKRKSFKEDPTDKPQASQTAVKQDQLKSSIVLKQLEQEQNLNTAQ